MKLALTEEMRALEQRAIAVGMTEHVLMELAGRGVAELLVTHGRLQPGQRIVVLVGPGNNGGDGLVAAYYLHRAGFRSQVYLTRTRENDHNLARVLACHIPTALHTDAGAPETLRRWLNEADAVLDGLLGMGTKPPLRGAILEVLQIAAAATPIGTLRAAIDVPTGVDSDTGAADPHAFRADLTLATGMAKPGCFVGPGADLSGAVYLADIGLAPEWEAELPLERTIPALVATLLPPRPASAHKGTFGRALRRSSAPRRRDAPEPAWSRWQFPPPFIPFWQPRPRKAPFCRCLMRTDTSLPMLFRS